MRDTKLSKYVIVLVTFLVPLFLTFPVLADSSGISQVESFISSIIKTVGGLAGLVAALFFVIGGFQYMTSSGSPERMEKAKRTLVHASIGLSIVIGAFVIVSIVSNLASSAFGN